MFLAKQAFLDVMVLGEHTEVPRYLNPQNRVQFHQPPNSVTSYVSIWDILKQSWLDHPIWYCQAMSGMLGSS